jgi:transcriptional regulator with XRE-family HTH domain/KaiC/GvpD/RAD55 family RecA-like ATPase
MFSKRNRVSSGVGHLDSLLDGLLIGDNVVWYDDAGTLASVFCLNFIRVSREKKKPIIYVSFDHSPKNLLEKLGPLSENPFLIIVDCFTCGKGVGSELFLNFYDKRNSEWPCQIIRADYPDHPEKVMELIYGVHSTLEADVRFIFDSLTGMQQLWGKEEYVLKLYSQSCPRLYELNTIAYWIIEKHAHSSHLRAHINKVAQVAIDLSLKRGRTSLTILKAEKRGLEIINKPHRYQSKDLNIVFDAEARPTVGMDLGRRLKELRSRRGLSQTDLAKFVGVSPSNISQIESNLIYPSFPLLLKMAEVLSIDITSFFQGSEDKSRQVVFRASEEIDEQPSDSRKGGITTRRLTPADFEAKAEPYVTEIPPQKKPFPHFLIHKGEEIGYLLSGKLQMKLENSIYNVNAGDLVYLTHDIPSQWKNMGSKPARFLWMKVNK